MPAISSIYMVVFRIIHIGAGVAWAGSVFFLVVYLQPATAAVGPAAQPVMRELLGTRKLVDRIIMLAATTIVGGLFLYWKDWHDVGSLGDWLGTNFGAVLTVGMLSALVAVGIGVAGTRPAVARLLEVGGRIAASEGPPAPELVAEVPVLQLRLKNYARLSLAFVAIAVLAMATARYW